MRRVRRIHALRLAINGVTISCVLLALALWGIGREVWVAMVLHNAPTNLVLLPRFYLAAFSHTRVAVQLLTLLTAFSFVYLARETSRLFSQNVFHTQTV
jgi:hypothetical protein